jgi:hypothetical protein
MPAASRLYEFHWQYEGRSIMKVLIFPLALIAVLAIAKPLSAAADEDPGWILDQTRPALKLESVVYISARGIKYENGPQGISSVAGAPDWTLFHYNNNSKTFSTQTKQVWSQEHKGMAQAIKTISAATGAAQTQYVKGAATTIAGLKATQYAKPSGKGWLEFCTAANIQLPAVPKELASYLTGTPAGTVAGSAVLLQMSIIGADGKRVALINTTSCRRAAIPPETFKAPAGYRCVTSIEQVADQQK